jgi:hypothetical protein
VTHWQSIIERAAYTRFCKTGSLEPFRLKNNDLWALARQVGGVPEGTAWNDVLRVQVRIPVPAIRDGVVVLVEEWTGP